MEVTPNLLERVAHDNQAIHQLGESIHDGVTWEVAEDLGFMRPEDAARLPIDPRAASGVRLEDPELDADWHEQRQQAVQQAAKPLGRTAIKRQRDNARKHERHARQIRHATGF